MTIILMVVKKIHKKRENYFSHLLTYYLWSKFILSEKVVVEDPAAVA